MKRLRAVSYAVGRGRRGMSQTPLVQLLAALTTAVSMMLLGAVMLVWVNAQGIAQSWGIDVPMTVYLLDEAAEEGVEELERRLLVLPEVERVERISPSQALERLAAGLDRDAGLVAEIDASILPDTLEVHLAGTPSPTFERALATRVEAFAVVDEVALAGDWAHQAHAVLRTLSDVAVGAAVLVALAGLAIIWSTIRLAVYARRTEIQILRLVGGTASFVRGPFIVEGALQGALGASLALAFLRLGFDAVRPFLEEGLALLLAASALRFFSPFECALGISFGVLLGVVGSRLAAGRRVEA